MGWKYRYVPGRRSHCSTLIRTHPQLSRSVLSIQGTVPLPSLIYLSQFNVLSVHLKYIQGITGMSPGGPDGTWKKAQSRLKLWLKFKDVHNRMIKLKNSHFYPYIKLSISSLFLNENCLKFFQESFSRRFLIVYFL